MTQLTDDCFAFGGDLMTASDALALLDQRLATVVEAEQVGLRQAVGRILAEDLTSRIDVPPHDNAAVDGYAFAHQSLSPDADTGLAVVARVAAGEFMDGSLKPGEAARIFTGAAMPAGADTVVMQEDVRTDGDSVIIPPGLKPGANRRRAGEDSRKGSVVLAAGRRLKPQDVGLAASVGYGEVPVYRRLKVALFSTGDELIDPGGDLRPGAIFDANRFALAGQVEALGCELTDLGILADDFATMQAALAAAARDHDLLITSGGVSTGDEDHVKPVVEALGSLHFWRLAIKPGRPLALGQVGQTPFLGLPGNPVAAMVCFLRFGRPMIQRLSGQAGGAPNLYRVPAAFDHAKKAGRREWLRARLGIGEAGQPVVDKFAQQGSGVLTSMVASDGLVELPEDVTEVRPGELVDFLPFTEVAQ